MYEHFTNTRITRCVGSVILLMAISYKIVQWIYWFLFANAFLYYYFADSKYVNLIKPHGNKQYLKTKKLNVFTLFYTCLYLNSLWTSSSINTESEKKKNIQIPNKYLIDIYFKNVFNKCSLNLCGTSVLCTYVWIYLQ